jgi:hypothetical protein
MQTANLKQRARMAITSRLPVGFIDRTGRMVIEPNFEEADSSRGPRPVKAGGKFGFIDASGKFIIKPKYFYCRSFSQGVANVTFEPKGTLLGHSLGTGCIDKTGCAHQRAAHQILHYFSEVSPSCMMATSRRRGRNGRDQVRAQLEKPHAMITNHSQKAWP